MNPPPVPRSDVYRLAGWPPARWRGWWQPGAVAVGSLSAQAATPSSFDAVQVKTAFAGSMVVVNEGLTESPCLRVAPQAWIPAAVPCGSGESIAVNLYRDNGSCSGTPIHIVRTVPANPESPANLWLDLTGVRQAAGPVAQEAEWLLDLGHRTKRRERDAVNEMP